MNTTAPYRLVLLKKSFWLFSAKVLPIVVLFLITILYSRKLSYQDYGKFQSLWMYVNLLNVIISFGITSLLLSSNLSRLFVFIKRHLSKIICAYALLSAIVITLFFLYGKNITPKTKGLVVLLVLIQSTGTIFETLLIKFHKEKIVFFTSFFYSVLFFVWHYYVLTASFNLNNLVGGIIIISLLELWIILLFKQNQNTISEEVSDHLYFKHWLYLGLNDITGVVSRWIDKLLLVYLLTSADFALFFNGSFEIPLFSLFISVTGSVMLIEMSKDVSTKEKIIDLFSESFRMLPLIVFPLFLFLIFFRTELFAVMFQHKYDASIPVFLVSIFILPLRINNYSSILQYHQKGNKIMAGSLLDIGLAIILTIILYPIFGTRGVAAAIVIATYCQVLYYLWQSAKVLNTDILTLVPVKKLLTIFIMMLLIFTGLHFSVYKLSNGLKLIVGLATTSVVILSGLFFYFRKIKLHNGF